jgi:SCY1-like protein 2
MEGINFLHANAKTIHLNLSPEHIYVTKEGKIKIAGFNFIQQFVSNETVSVHFDFIGRIGELAPVPNMKFAAPETTDSAMVSTQSDIFSIGALIFYLAMLTKEKPHKAYLLNQSDFTNKQMHINECGSLEKRLQEQLKDFDPNLASIIR